MNRRVDACDLVGAHEIAMRLQVARPQVVHEWRKRHYDFPQPLVCLHAALVWDWAEVERWAFCTGRLPERPTPPEKPTRRSPWPNPVSPRR